MSNIHKYIRKASASERADFDLPVIDTPEEALRVVRDVAEQLKHLPNEERLSLLSDLCELSKALTGRIERLQQELAVNRAKLHDARVSRRACASYARNAGVVVPLGAKRRPPCP
jgi:hypothetical protein